MRSDKFKDIGVFLAVFLPVYAAYLYTAPRTVYWQDAGIYLAGIKTLGVIYPPGFPLYVFFGWVWVQGLTWLFGQVLTFAQMVHAFSGLWGAMTAGVVGVAVYDLIEAVRQKDISDKAKKAAGFSWHRFVSSLVAGLSAGFSYSLWSQSINAEVYSLAGFFAALIFLIVIRLVITFFKTDRSGRGERIYKLLFALSVVWGLSFANHPVTVVFLPGLVWLLWRMGLFVGDLGKGALNVRKKKVFLWRMWVGLGLVFFLFGALPYIYLPIRSAAEPEMLWSKIDSLRNFLAHVTGRVYLTRERAVNLFNFKKFASYPVLLFQEFFLFGIGLGFIGWKALKRIKGEGGLLVEFGVVFTSTLYILVSFYERGTEYNFWLIPFYILISILIGYGIWSLTRSNKSRLLMVGVLGLGILLPQFLLNWPLVNRRDYVLAQEFGHNLLGKLPEGAILFTIGDQSSAIPKYLQMVEDYRRDVVVVWDSTFVYDWQRERLKRRYPELVVSDGESEDGKLKETEAERVINEFIAENLEKREVFLITKKVIPLAEEFKLVPAGTLWKVTKDEAEEIDLAYWDYSFSDPKRYKKPERFEHGQDEKDAFGNVIGIKRIKYSDEAKNFEMQSKKNLAEWCKNGADEGKTLRVRVKKEEVEMWKEKRLLECAMEAYEDLIYMDPMFYHKDIYLGLADVYQKLGKEEDAKKFYNEVLKRSQATM